MNRILATSVGLMLLVSTVVGLLGWRLFSQEEALLHQQARDSLERTADHLITTFVHRLEEIEAWLGQKTALAAGDTPIANGAIVVWLSKGRIDVVPSDRLLYYPTVSPSRPINATIFARVDHLERDGNKPDAAVSALVTLTKSQDRVIWAEATLRLARLQAEQGQVTEALLSYEGLSRMLDAEDPPGETGISQGLVAFGMSLGGLGFFTPPVPDGVIPRRLEWPHSSRSLTNPAGVPYRLLSLFARCQLLANSGHLDEAREEARRLVSEISSGRWRLDKMSHAFYDTAARKLAGLAPPPPTRLAVTQLVASLWDEWQLFERTGSQTLTKRMHQSEFGPSIAIVHENSDRLVALIANKDSLRTVGLDLTAGDDVRASLTDDQGRLILGQPLRSDEFEVTRSLSVAGFPWQLRVAASNETANAFLRTRRNYSVMGFSVFILLVAGACYAIARGALREASAGRLQGDFVSAVSHEFRSPLTALRQLTELLAHGRVIDESRRRLYFDVLLKETSRLHLLVEDLLDFGRMDGDRQQYEFESLDLSELVRDTVREYQSEAHINGHEIDLTTDKSPIIVNADRRAMKRVVRNLLENAVKYSPGTPTVWIQTECAGRTAVLRVRDEGLGVPPNERSRIFEKFVRGEAAKNACIRGTGIGLAMVKEIVRTHQGEVDLYSEVDRGSTFVVRLPCFETLNRGVS